MKNICFIVNDFNFFYSHRYDLAKTLIEKYNYSVSVICSIGNASLEDIKICEENAIKVIHLRQRSEGGGVLKYLINLHRVLKHNQFEQLIFVTLELSFLGAILGILNRKHKRIFIISGIGHHYFLKTMKQRLLRKLEKIVFRISAARKSGNYFVFQNNDDLKLFTDRGFTNKKFSIVIPGNGINTNQFPFFSRDYLQQPIFLFASKLLISKGVEEYLEAARQLIKKDINAKFLIAGKYDLNESDPISPSSYAALQNDCQVTYLGELSYEQMSVAFNNSTIFVLPSYGEGLPKVLLEAAATGLPLITTNVSGCKDCIENGKNGKLIKPKDLNELKDAMESFVLTDANTMLKYSKKSSFIVNDKFSLDVIAKKYIALIG